MTNPLPFLTLLKSGSVTPIIKDNITGAKFILNVPKRCLIKVNDKHTVIKLNHVELDYFMTEALYDNETELINDITVFNADLEECCKVDKFKNLDSVDGNTVGGKHGG